MLWVVQTNLFQSNRRDDVIATLQRFQIPFQLVEAVQSSIYPEVEYSGPIITNGSIMLSNIAEQRGWKPGSFVNQNFSYSVWHPLLHDLCLNAKIEQSTLQDADPNWDRIFIRPVTDQKSFNGTVLDRALFHTWKQQQLERGILAGTQVICSAAQPSIGQEHRHFIVNGEVVSSSRYRLGGAVNESPDVDPAVIGFAEQVAARWSPARAFVLDTFQTDQRIGVVELGGICHAGFYRADVQAIILALDDMSW